MDNEDVAEIIRRQHGVISRQQALDARLTRREIDGKLARREWQRVQPCVYHHSAVRRTWHGALLAGCLTAGGVASHRAAAVLDGIDGYRAGRREIIVPEGSWKAVDGVVVHETRQWRPREHVVRDGIPCTPLARTTLDLAAVVDRHRLDDTIDALLRSGRLELADLYDVLVRHARRGRDGCGRLREALDARRPDAGVPLSSWSRMVARLLDDAGLPTPELEHRVLDTDDRLIAQVDLAYPTERVAIELDSVTWHLDRRSFRRDRERWNALTLAGWTSLVFTWSMYADDPAALVAMVRAAIEPELPR